MDLDTLRPAGHRALLEAARQEFAERGYGSTSIRDIAQRAGVSLSALYHYYGGKQELLHALLDEGMDRYRRACDTALAGAGDDPAERLEALVEATVRFRAGQRDRSAVELTEDRSLNDEQRAHFHRRRAEATRMFQDVVEDGRARALFLTPYPDDARRAVIAMCNAVAQWYRPDGELTVDDLVERYVSLALTLVEYRPRRARRSGPDGRTA
ncbi:TetR/AcrR family transcriptional regulator [Streptacidiphilus sp. ASG 303]|uniref:TetR family transcriptional regulator n=1 Tax=Streptacidiphilus sp. ASG 303 TaxID=2896847 RepID=UPI001E3F44E7|nr:TetR family transcriptional regulator [Streptacidiphilus sp. ASG 303]MCD0483990.1 TetR/AcrR family transcriptional regulator [Streptacidiphilus sp. ASG 303]